MKRLIQFFIDNNKLTLILTLFFVVVGVMGLKNLNSESFPAVNFAMVNVTTSYPGASPEEVETEVTKEIEEEIRGVSGLKDVRSVSQAGLSKIVVRVDIDDPNIDVQQTLDDLQSAVQRVSDLPAGIKEQPLFKKLDSQEFPAIEIAVAGPNDNRKRDLFSDFLKDMVEDSKRVLNVRLVGYREREFAVRLNPEKMDLYHIGISEVFNILQARNKNFPSGYIKSIERSNQTLVRVDGKVETIESLQNVVVRSNFSGKKVYLKDIADVLDYMEDPGTLTRVNGEEATLLVVTKKAGADTIALVREVEEKIKLSKKNQPDDLKITIYNNEAKKVDNRMNVLTSNAISGLLLVILFLFIFLPGKIGIVASLSLPLAVMATLGYMSAIGTNLNAITILALVIALGMLVDNSVVISENYTRLRQEGLSSYEAAIKAVHQFWLPITATAMTTIAAFIPMLVTRGIMGQFIRFIPLIVSMSLVMSLVESFFLLPMRLNFIGKYSKVKMENGEVKHDWFHKISLKFEKFVNWGVVHRYKMLAVFTSIIFFSLFLLVKGNKFILFPADQTEIYVSRFELNPGTPVEIGYDFTRKLSQSVKEVLGDNVENIVARAGISMDKIVDPKGKESSNVGMLTIYMTREASFVLKHTDVLDKLRQLKFPEAKKVTFEALVHGPPVGEPVSVTFRAHDQKKLDEFVDLVGKELGSVPGIFDVADDEIIGDDEIHIDLDYEKIARLGLDVNLIGSTIKTALEGKPVTKLNINNKKFDLKVRLGDDHKTIMEDLQKTKIMDHQGNLIPLHNLAYFKKTEGRPVIKRFDFQRAKMLTANIDQKVITSFLANKKLLEIYNKHSHDYPEVTLTFGGEQESTKESVTSLIDAMGLALIGIFAILVFIFSSYFRPLIIMTTIPLGLLGVSVSFYLHGKPVSFLAMIGVVGLSGIIVNSGIVLISFIEELRLEGRMPLHDILAHASRLRLRAVLVTSLTTIGGLLPTAYGIGGTDVILIPMTLAMAWGLTSGTILTLIWVPCAYAIVEDFTLLMGRIWAKLSGHKLEEEIEVEEDLQVL